MFAILKNVDFILFHNVYIRTYVNMFIKVTSDVCARATKGAEIKGLFLV